MSTKEEVSAAADLLSYYEHTPLPSKRSIRLLEILHETSVSFPQCKLSTVSLDDEQSFFTLSYTWDYDPSFWTGEKTEHDLKCCQILCNGRLLDVTQNLYNFLKRAKPEGSKGILDPGDKIWIDAICIDQSDVEERNAQVRLMSEIYRTAKAVHVWLGESEPIETEAALELLERLSTITKEDQQSLKKASIQDPIMIEVLGEIGGSIDHWLALKKLCSRPWLSRVWIIQEVAFANTVRVFCGGYNLQWDAYKDACRFLTYSVVSDLEIPSRVGYNGFHVDTLESRAPNSTNIVDVLVQIRSFESTDPRDKVFAILGLAGFGSDLLAATDIVHVDYELETSEVFVNLMWDIIEHAKDMDFLAEVESRFFRRVENLPTWVPDLSATERPKMYNQSTPFDAGRNLTGSLKRLPNPHLLSMACYRLGEVVHQNSLLMFESFAQNCGRTLSALYKLPQTYVSGEDRVDVLWRTLIQNGYNWQSPADPDTSTAFRNWILVEMAEEFIKATDNPPMQELIGEIIDHLVNFSTTDKTDIMPTRDEFEDTIKRVRNMRKGSKDELLSDKMTSAGQFRHEFLFYQHMLLLRTDNGLLGLGQPSQELGDSIWIIPGVWVPMVLRSTEQEDYFEVVGPAYVHGVMYGEALDWEWLESRLITLQ